MTETWQDKIRGYMYQNPVRSAVGFALGGFIIGALLF